MKAAVTIGALAGGTIAIVNNKQKLLELSESLFQKGADFCRERLEEEKMKFSTNLEDGALKGYDSDSENESDLEPDYNDSEITTPEGSDVELDLESLD